MLSYGVVPLIYPPFVYFYFRPIWTHVAAVQHLSSSHIDTHMGNARCIVSADEKDQVAGPCFGRRYRGGNIVEPLAPSLPVLQTPLCVSTQDTKPEQSKEVFGLLPPQT